MTFKLILRNVLAHPIRSFLTTGSIAFAVLLLSVLLAAVSSLTTVVDKASTKRLWVQSAVSLFINLPQAYESKIAAVDGVDFVSKWQWFGGIYKEKSNFFAQFGIDHGTFLKSFPEITVTEGSYEAFGKNRVGCIVGQDLADKYGFKVGDIVPIMGEIFPRTDGKPWEFKVEGVYQTSVPSVDQAALYFHYDYLDESIESGAVQMPQDVGVYMVRPKAGANPVQIASAIDLLFKDGPQRTKTDTEADFNKQFITMLGNVPLLLQSICGGVLFAIFFAVLNTMLMAGHERTRDIGVMKALGFSDGKVGSLLVFESMLLCTVGGLIGASMAKGLESVLQKMFAAMIQGFAVQGWTLMLGLGIALAIGLVAGLAPARRALRITPIAALREEG